jgi:peptidoglycan hydrolase CwlO-like protein
MKLPSTMPVSKGLVTKSALVAAAVVMAVSAPISLGSRVFADQYDDQIAALRAQMSQYQNQASALDAQADSYQAELDKITAEKNAILAQIDLSQQQYDQLQKQIADTTKQIADNKDALGQVIADMYVDDSISPLEMLASSKNIGDYVDKQEYRESMQSTLSTTIDQINALKKKLETSKKEVEKVLEEQKNQKAQLAAKEAEQQVLVDKTRGDEAAYQKLASDAAAQAESAAAQQRAYYASLQAQNGGSFDGGTVGSFTFANWSGNMGCGGDGYPYCGAMDSYADPWQLYNRECVSYAAWKIDRVYGKAVQPFGGYGMAYQWGQGYAKGAWRVTDPQQGDAVVLPVTPGFAPVGHLMVVESVSGDWVHVSQYNFFGTGEYSTMDIKKSGVIFLRFPNG